MAISKLSSIRNIFIYENIDNVNFIQDENVKKSLKELILTILTLIQQ